MTLINGLCVDKATNTTGAIAMTVTPITDSLLDCVSVKLSSAGGAGSLTITIDDGEGVVYDLVLATQDMTSVTDYLYLPTRPIPLKSGDKILIAYPNANNRTYGVKVKYRQV